MTLQAGCPSCGGPVAFQVSTSLVTVCPYCRSVVGRGDRGLESLGKVADLVETASPLDVGLKGRFDNVPFDLTGRTQFAHPAGGVWDEWYASFADGRWGWLAEAQGRFYVTFETPVPGGLPSYDDLELGQVIEFGDGVKLMVAEKNRGTTASARGEIPYRVVPGEVIPFADLSGPRGEFATIDYSGGKPTVYLGRQVTLDELHIPPGQRRKYPGQEPRIAAVAVNCPRCGGALELRAPDRSERVGCPSCGALSDVKEGKLSLLHSLQPTPVQPILPLGSVGKYEGIDWTVIGFMQRYVTLEGVDYPWEEYLLYQPRLGFRWLTRSDDHWNWVEAIPVASVRLQGRYATYADRSYRLFQKAEATVAFVAGEFYWKVQAGETVRSKDYVAAPFTLSEEASRDGGEGELNWSLGTYLTPTDVEAMFGLRSSLPRPANIAPNQPFPYPGIYRTALWFLVAGLLLGLVSWAISPGRSVFAERFDLKPLPDGQRDRKHTIEEISLKGRQNIRVSMTPAAGTDWCFVGGVLVPRNIAVKPGETAPKPNQTQRRFSFLASARQTAYVYLDAVPAGEYDLQLTLAWRNPKVEGSVEVKLHQGVSHPYPLLMVLLILGVVPLLVGLYQLWFESRRWGDSNVA